MIRAGVTGGSLMVAGEIIKLLINHPDVEISWVIDPSVEGALLSQVHKGLRGETYMRFTSEPAFDNVDVIFLCFDEPGDARRFVETKNLPDRIRLIDLSGDYLADSTFADGDRWIYGLPELSRKPLVRGATRTAVPHAISSAILLSLLPMAKASLLNTDISVTAVVAEPEAEPGEALALIELEEEYNISRALRSLQQDFASKMMFIVMVGGWKRGISVTIHFECSASEEQLLDLYDKFYEDHGFTFMSSSLPNLTEVNGTNKCIINLQKVGDRVVVTAVIDDLIKGASAMAVHDMNLLFGLQERVGLMLKTCN